MPVQVVRRPATAGRRAGSFAGKASGGGGGGAHPVGRITRLGLWGHNTQRCASFAGKTPSVPVVQDLGGILLAQRKRRIQQNNRTILAAVAAIIPYLD